MNQQTTMQMNMCMMNDMCMMMCRMLMCHKNPIVDIHLYGL
jgi:hypothetical protein